jgi:hypothetical protein
VVLKICSLSLSAAIMRWKSGEPAFAVEVYYSNGYSVIATLPKSLQCWVLSRIRNQLLHNMGHYVQTNQECDKTKNSSLTSITGVESPLARFGPLQFCLWVFSETPRLYQPSKDPTRPEGQHLCRNCQHTRCYVMANA